ncbi:uncharacterized protein LOC135699212 [Ochlerotatus camptorhynchus]|uniref:uncharacterized protein LOC135699212 n=1 Tax=Ochlerotatus camptorhynchus TaxID=644619 RepID=UPI0031DEBD43
MWLHRKALLTLLSLVIAPTIVYGDSVEQLTSVMVNPRKVTNYIAKEFACFSAKPRSVFQDSLNPISDKTFQMAKNLGPMYMKVYGDSSQLELKMDGFAGNEEDSGLVQITPNGWRAFNKWAQEAGLVPVFVLDYSEDSWKPRNALKVLTVANKLGITNCLWQLGTGNITDAVKYIDDLRAFKAITRAFKYRGIVACDVDRREAGVDQARYFNLYVDEIADAISVVYEPRTTDIRLQEFVLQRESFVRGPVRSHLPIWLDVRLPTAVDSGTECNETCLREGLRYATLLGDAARNGFNAVFKSLSREEIQSYSFIYLIALLHRSTIGTKVFNVPQITEDDVQIYAYCSRSANGSFALMGVNHHPEGFEFDLKLSSKQYSTEVQQYVVTVVDGQIQLNDQAFDFESSLEPFAKIRPILKGLQLTIPGYAIAFWVIPNLNLRECFDDYQDLRTKVSRSISELESPVDQLLQELIEERAHQHDITQMSRRKRSTDHQLEETIVGKLKQALQKRGLKGSAKRPPRQTINYRRKQRTVRLKEKRAERRNLKQQRRPLRERGKRQLRKRNRCANPSKCNTASKKTKRSSLAEAVNQPPVFGESYEEQVNRSSFPQGDVHLVISKGPEEEELLSIEEAPIRDSRLKKSRKKKTSRRKPASEKDLRFVVPEMAFIRNDGVPRPELEPAESIHRKISLNTPEEITKPSKVLHVEPELIKVSDIRMMEAGFPATTRQEKESPLHFGSDSTDSDNLKQEWPSKRDKKQKSKVSSSLESFEYSKGHSSELSLSMMSDEDDSGHDTSEAYIEELTRRKRSIGSGEIDRIEAFFMNNTKLQQKFTEMFDMLLESFNCCGEAADENSAREEPEEEISEQVLQRAKRNALLHPRSLETNMLHQRRTSQESHENMIPTEPMSSVQKIPMNTTVTSTSAKDDSGRAGAFMLKSVAQFIKGMTTGLNKMLYTWFPKTSKE